MANESVVLMLSIVAIAVLTKQRILLASKFNQKSSNTVCQSKSCDAAGYALSQAINFSANPCDNFYEYACGNWEKNNPIPDNKSKVNTFSILKEKIISRMKKLLKQDNTTLENESKGKNAQSVQFAIDLYGECIDRDSIEKLGIKPIQKILKQMFEEWPILKPTKLQQSLNLDGFYNTFKLFNEVFVGSIFFIKITVDANQTDTKRIHFDSPNFGLGRKEYNDTKSYENKVNAYKLYMERVLKLFSGMDYDSAEIKNRIEDLFQFESKLALATTEPEKLRYATEWYNRMTLAEFQNVTNNYHNWTAIINDIITHIGAQIPALSDQDLVIVNDIAYYKIVSKLITETPEYVINNYLGWILVISLAEYANDQLFDIDFEYNKVVTGVMKKTAFWYSCINQVNSFFEWAISRLYIDRYVNPQTKLAANKLIQSLRQSFHELILQVDWLDQETRTKTVDKLNNIRSNVAYPEWILENDKLDKYYGITEGVQIAVVKGKYFKSLMNFFQHRKHWVWSQINEPIDIEMSWPMPPAIINAAYSPTQNSITIPVGILYLPFFDSGRPASMNFGSIGEVIGHEISHGFDDQGRQFGKTGNLVEWWTEKTKQRFDASSKCFIEQYGAIKDQSVNKNLNGMNTLGENIADNGGVRASYMAFQNYLKGRHTPEPSLPHMKTFSPSQLFFLSYANTWCDNTRHEVLTYLIDYNEHCPSKYRVNVPLGNFFDEFSLAFNCSKESPMNAKTRCRVW